MVWSNVKNIFIKYVFYDLEKNLKCGKIVWKSVWKCGLRI